MKKVFYTLSAVFLISCGGSKMATTSPTITDGDLARGKQTYPDLTMESLNEGKGLFEKQCTQCHAMKKPGSRTAEQWHDIVPKMAGKANKKAGSDVINAQMQESILKYLVTMSKG
jgi:cytochrome c2